jgi:SAM-dependent methyltransferase
MIQTFLDHFRRSAADGNLLKCTLSKPTSAAPTGLQNVYIRLVQLKNGLHLAFNHRYKTRDEVKNHLPDAALAQLEAWLGPVFEQADLFTATNHHSLTLSKKHPPKLINKASSTQAPTAPDLNHNRAKHRLLDPAAPWLHKLSIANAQGQILPTSQDKWRQISKFTEIIDSLLRHYPMPTDARIADMGSGKGYLTFALYDLLRQRPDFQPQVTGIELRQNLVDFCNKTAREVGFDGLSFQSGSIETFQPERLDLLMALHACDTATDLAIAAGIRQRASIIVIAPCCHKQIRRDMHTRNELAPVLRHGILEERQAEIVTDGIRALLLEAHGYRTQVFEFISTEHTAKNVMITAVASLSDAVHREEALAQIAALKAGFGVAEHYLERLL